MARGIVGAGESFVSGLTSPTNLAIIAGTMGVGASAPIVTRLVSLGFSYQMFRDAVEQVPGFTQQVKDGDVEGATKTLSMVAAGLYLGRKSAEHGLAPEGLGAIKPHEIAPGTTRELIPDPAEVQAQEGHEAVFGSPAPGIDRGPAGKPTPRALAPQWESQPEIPGPPDPPPSPFADLSDTALRQMVRVEAQGPKRAALEAEMQLRFGQPPNRAQRRATTEIPETGTAAGVAEGVDKRNRIAQQYGARSYEDLSIPDKLAVDNEIAEGNTGAASGPPPSEPVMPAAGPSRVETPHLAVADVDFAPPRPPEVPPVPAAEPPPPVTPAPQVEPPTPPEMPPVQAAEGAPKPPIEPITGWTVEPPPKVAAQEPVAQTAGIGATESHPRSQEYRGWVAENAGLAGMTPEQVATDPALSGHQRGGIQPVDPAGQAGDSGGPGEAGGAEGTPPGGRPVDDGAILGSGLGALQPAVDAMGRGVSQFTREEAIPKVLSILRGTKETVEAFVNMLAPRVGVKTKLLDQVYALKGGRDAAEYLLSAKLDAWSDRLGKMPQAAMVDFIDRQKTGKAQLDPELQQLSDFLKKADDALYTEITKYKPSLAYLENHYRVLWKVIPGAQQAPGFKGVFRRPLQGTKGFLLQHTLENMSEGLALGGVPYSYNPSKMFQAHYADVMKYVTAQRLWEQFGKSGVRQFAKSLRDVPDGFERLDDRIAKVYFSTPQGLVTAGEWYVEKGAARLLNNLLSRDLIREKPLGRALLDIKNSTTAIELAISPFHAVFETFEAIGSQIGIGMREMWNLGVRKGDVGAFGRGVKSILTAPGSAVSAAKLGATAKKAFGTFQTFSATPEGQAWLKKYPNARDDVQDFFMGGGRIGMHEDYKIQALSGFKDYLASARNGGNPGHYISAAIRSVPALNQAIMSPLFEHYIPNLKLGFFLKEFSLAKQEYADRLASGEMTKMQLARQVVDSVENRFGEMNFDNLFWDRTFKTAAQLLTRSVTWKLGNLRAMGGAGLGEFNEVRRAIQNKELPMLHPNMSWLLGMSLWTAVLGGTIHTIATGKPPQQLKDVVYPVIDGLARIRVSMPTYWRDIVHLQHDPVGYVTSSLSGEIGKVAEVWQNKDFDKREIRNPDDSYPAQGLDILKHLIPVPFSVSSYDRSKQMAGSPLTKAAGYLGFTKAPRYIEETPAEGLAADYASAHRLVGNRTAQQAARTQALAGIRNTLRRGGDVTALVKDAEQKGLMVRADLLKLRQQAKQPGLVSSIQRDSITEALNIYDAASAEERKGITRLVKNKLAAARRKPWEWTPQATKLAAKHFNIQHRPPRNAAEAAPDAASAPF